MADNTTLNTGSGGDVIATDDIGGVKHQRVKIQHGTDGSATDVSTASPLPVGDAGGSLTVDNAALSVTGGGTEATALRVTVASDSTGVLSVDDNGGSLTVDVGTALPAGTNNIGDVDVLTLPALPAGTNNIGDVDVLSVVPGTSATSLGKAEDAAHTTGDTGVAVLGVRRDALAVGSGTDGDYSTINVDASGRVYTSGRIIDDAGDSCMDGTNNALRVNIVAGAGSGGTSTTDDAAFTIGSTGVTPIGGLRNDARDTVDDGDTGALAMTPARALYTTVETPNGDSAMDETNNAVRVTIVAGAGSGGSSMTDDAAFTPGTSGVNPAAGIYRSSRDLVDDNDAGALAMTQRRALLVQLENSSGTEQGTAAAPIHTRLVDASGDSCMDSTNDALRVNVIAATGIALEAGSAEIGSVRLTDGTDTAAIDSAGNVAANVIGRDAHDAALSGNPVGVGARASTATPAAVSADDDAVRLWASRRGVLHTAVRDDDGDSCMDNTNAALRVNIVAGSSSGTEYTEDAAAAANPAGGALIVVRDDARAGSLTSADGDNVALRGTNAGELYVKHTDPLPTGSNEIGRVRITDGSFQANVFDLSGGGALYVGVADGAGNQITSFGTHAEDAAHASTDVGVMALAVRRDTAAVGSGTDGDYSTLNVNASGRLYTSTTVDAALPAGTNNIGDVDVLSVVPGTAATSLGKAEDDAHASGDVGVLALAVRRDTAAVGSGTDGDNSTLNVNASGRLYTSTTIDAALPAGTNNIGDVDILSIAAGDNNIGNVDIVSVPAPLSTTGGGTEATALRVTVASDSTGVLSVDDNGGSITIDGTVTASSCTGAAAHDSAVSGNPVLQGFEARTTDGTAVSTGDVVRPIADTLGKQVVHVGSIPALVTSGTLNRVNTTAADVIAAAGAGVKIVVTSILVTNAHATVSTKVSVRDGTTVKWTGYAAAVGGGFSVCGSTPLFVGTANTAVTAICGTTGADVDITVSGYTITN